VVVNNTVATLVNYGVVKLFGKSTVIKKFPRLFMNRTGATFYFFQRF
jgi:hypothetical protein